GASGCGRGVMPLARDMLRSSSIPTDRLVFVDDNPVSDMVNGDRVLSYSDFLAMPASSHHAVLAVANGRIREMLVSRLQSSGVQFWSVQAATAVVMDDVQIGEGAIISPFVTMTSNIRIGKHFHANLYSYVEHDCVIGDFVT